MQQQWMARVTLLVLLLITGWLATFSNWPLIEHINDKLQHIAAFFALAGAVFFSFPRTALRYRLGALLFLGLALEAIQLLIPHREFHLDDWAASFAGACLFELIYTLFRLFRNRMANRY